jgi:hypothetical protein
MFEACYQLSCLPLSFFWAGLLILHYPESILDLRDWPGNWEMFKALIQLLVVLDPSTLAATIRKRDNTQFGNDVHDECASSKYALLSGRKR